MSREEHTVAGFMEAINAHDVAAIATLISADHLFVDSLGHALAGKDAVSAAWRGYFGLCPDYWIDVDQVFHERDCIGIFGAAGGTIGGSSWRTPAAWLARASDGCVTAWRVFADNKPVYDILARMNEVP
jgi:ketosteroid isomerase-like protein